MFREVVPGPDRSVLQLDVTMTAQPPRLVTADEGRSGGLKGVAHVVAVSSCKGGTAPCFTQRLARLAKDSCPPSGACNA